MDITVAPSADGKTWGFTDLLGRDMGSITRSEIGPFPKDAGSERFMVCVDRQQKRSYAEQVTAIEEAKRLRALFPRILIEVLDARGTDSGAAEDKTGTK